jgi:hypothetical protein
VEADEWKAVRPYTFDLHGSIVGGLGLRRGTAAMQPATMSIDPFTLPPAEMMRSIDPGMFHPLVDAVTWERMTSLAAQFPAAVQTVCFECRLAAEDARTDLAFCLRPGFAVPRIADHLRRAYEHDLGWGRVADFLQHWVSPASDLLTRIPFICIAFDLAQAHERLPLPCLSLCVEPDFYAKRLGFVRAAPARAGEVLALAADCYAQLTGTHLPAESCARLASCVEGDDSLEPLHLSIMLPRAGHPMKVDLAIRADRVPAFLARIGWPEPCGRLESSLAAFARGNDRVQLNLVVHPDFAAPLEVELFAGDAASTASDRLPVLDKLVASGLASVEKANVLRDAWVRVSSLEACGRLVAQSWYLKIRFSDSDPRDAKAYLGLMPRTLKPETRA